MTQANSQDRSSSWKWYSVRSLYRLVAFGKPKNPGANYVADATLVEERIVLFKARSVEEVRRKAEKEGKTYARSIHITNGYGQKVKSRMLKGVDIYELFDSPSASVEVFSTTEEIDASVPDEQVWERLIGLGEALDQQEDPWPRFKFIDVKVIRLMLDHFQNSPVSSHRGKELRG